MGCLSFETIFSSLRAVPLTPAIYFKIQLFSMLFDLRFTPNALSTTVWRRHPVPRQRGWRCGDVTVLSRSALPNVVLLLQTRLKYFSIIHRPSLSTTSKVPKIFGSSAVWEDLEWFCSCLLCRCFGLTLFLLFSPWRVILIGPFFLPSDPTRPRT